MARGMDFRKPRLGGFAAASRNYNWFDFHTIRKAQI